ncbi:hypothetical protein BH10PAT1_BH10PAT1_6680 [soil metagenome]
MQKGPTTPKGFRDIDPTLAKKKRETINIIANVLEEFDFVPLETPIIEFAETLTGKYGAEEKLIYKFTDRGGRELALRYDLTVPLARYVANNLNIIAKEPFSRYQVGESFRGENTQKGRYREFTQFDMDTVGSTDPKIDAQAIAAAMTAARKLGLKNAKMMINDRTIFDKLGITKDALITMDKIDKIGKEGVLKELKEKNIKDPEKIFESVEKSEKTENLNKIFEELNKFGFEEDKDFVFARFLVRGLDYYTSTVLELKPTGQMEEQSIGGGGRYDDLIGMFAGRKIPAVGFSFGLDRLLELL